MYMHVHAFVQYKDFDSTCSIVNISPVANENIIKVSTSTRTCIIY